VTDDERVDPLQRSADRRRFQRIGFVCLIGLLFVGSSATMMLLGVEEGTGRYSYPHEFGLLVGAGWIAAGLFDLVRRLLTGPTKPGKRARY